MFKLKSEITDKDKLINDLMKLNMELQGKVIEEYPKLHQINEEIQTKVLNNFNELTCKYMYSKRNVVDVACKTFSFSCSQLICIK